MKNKKILFLVLLFGSVVLAAPLFNAFNSGVLSPLLRYRIDIDKRQMGVETLENFLVKQQGAAFRRPGTEYIYPVKDSNHTSRLFPFIYSTGDAYVIEAGNKYMRFYRTVDGNSGIILAGAGTGNYDANMIARWQLNDNDDNNDVADACDTYNGNLTDGNSEDIHKSGKIGMGCFNFSNYAGYVQIADNNSFTFDENDSPFSIAGWIFVEDTSEVQTIISKWEEGTAREWRLNLLSNEKLRFEFFSGAGLDANCISQWKLNDNAASTAVADAKSVHNGVATANTSALSTAGKLSGAFNFNTTYAVEVNDDANFTFAETSKPFSVAAWVYVTNMGIQQIILSKWNYSAAREWVFCLPSSGKFVFMIYDQTNNASCSQWSVNTLSVGWHFLAATYNSAGGATAGNGITLYADGQVADSLASNSASYVKMRDTTTKVVIGADYHSGILYEKFADKIDNAMIFNKVLSLAEIQSLYASGSGTEDLVGDSVYKTTDNSLTEGWHLIASTYNSAGGATAANGITLYVDGSEVNSTAHNFADYTAMENTSAKVRIGAQLSSLSEEQYVFANRLDDITIFNKKLTAANIASMYSISPFEIATVYDVNDLRQVKFIQKNDVMYMCHPKYPVQKLARYAHSWWEIEDADWLWGPFLDDNIKDDVTITPSATTGNIILTANKNLFNSKHEGSLWKITEKQTTTYLKETISGAGADANTNSLPIQGDYLLKLVGDSTYDGTVILEKSEDDGTTWIPVYQRPSIAVAYDVEYAGNEKEAGWEYKIITENQTAGSVKMTLTVYNTYIDGYVKITSYASPTTVNAKVINKLTGTTATNRWAEGAFSEYRGYPRAIGLYQNRLCLAGTTYSRNNFWASVSGDYENMRISSLDTGAIVYEVGSARQNAIRWLQDKQGILAGTSESLMRIFSQSSDSTLTGKSIGSERQSQIGSGDLQAQLLGDSIIFVDRNYRKVFDTVYDLQSDGFVSPELTTYAEHITDPCLLEVAIQSSPDPIVWFIRGDDNCVTLTYGPLQGVVAWAEQLTDGHFESTAVIPGTTEDEVWFVIERNIDGNNVRYIEKLHKQDWGNDPNDCWFVDSGIEYNDTETNTITGLSHLEGKEVQIFYDGNSVQTKTVLAGTITLDPNTNVTHALVGLPYTSTLITFPVELPIQNGTTVGYKKKIYEARGCFYKSMYGQYGYLGQFKPAVMYNVPFGSWPDALIGTDAPFTGQIKLPIESDNDDEVRLKFIQTEPYPFNLTALVIKLEISEN